jgi:outer membrane protein
MIRSLLFSAVLFSVIVDVNGQDNTNSAERKLTFQDAVKIGLKNNFDLQQQKNQLSYTQINKTSSMLQMGPRVEANGSFYRNDGNSFNQQRGEVVNGVIDFLNGSVSASMPVFNGLSQVNGFRSAHSLNEAQLHQVARSTQDVIQNVANNYLTCLLDQELVKIQKQNIETQRFQYEQIQSQVDLGARAEADLYNQEYQVKNAELLYIRAQNKLKNDLALLARSLALDPTVPLELEEVDWNVDTLLEGYVNRDEMQQTALSRRSDLKQAEYTEKARHYSYSAIKGRYYPSVYAGVSYGSRYNYIHGFDNRSFDDQFRHDNRQLSYGVSVTIPIFYGFQSRAQASLAKVQYKNAALDKDATEIRVKTEVMQAYQNFEDAKTNYLAAQAQLKAAELTYKTQKERYDLGISNVVEMNTTNQAYIQAQGDYQSALFTLMFQRLLIDYAVGTLTFEDIP